jgi:hypothetical protein
VVVDDWVLSVLAPAVQVSTAAAVAASHAVNELLL